MGMLNAMKCWGKYLMMQKLWIKVCAPYSIIVTGMSCRLLLLHPGLVGVSLACTAQGLQVVRRVPGKVAM